LIVPRDRTLPRSPKSSRPPRLGDEMAMSVGMRPGSLREARSSERPATRVPGVIRPDELYTIEEFVARTGLGETWRRRARRTGLQILYLNSRAFIWGGDFIDFVRRMATKEFRPMEKGSSATGSSGLRDAETGHSNSSGSI